MKRIIISFTAVLLTFAAGIICASSFRSSTFKQTEISLGRRGVSLANQGREAVLRNDLLQIRRAIDQYSVDYVKLPHSLADLVEAGYLRALPVDPMTGESDWKTVELYMCPISSRSLGIEEIHSNSRALSSEGTPYSDW